MNRLRGIWYLLGFLLINCFLYACSDDPLLQDPKTNSQSEKQIPEETPDSTTTESNDSTPSGITAVIPGYELGNGSD